MDREGDPTRLRPVRAGDVVLLFRAMSNVAPLRGGPARAGTRLLPRRRAGLLRPAGDLRPPQSAPRPGEPAGRRQPGRRAAVAVLLPQRRGAVRAGPARATACGPACATRRPTPGCRPTSASRCARARRNLAALARPEGPAADRPPARRRLRRLRLRRGDAVRIPRRPQAGQPVEAAGPGPHLRPLRPVRPGRVHRPARRSRPHPAARGAGGDAAGERRRGPADDHSPGEGAGVPRRDRAGPGGDGPRRRPAGRALGPRPRLRRPAAGRGRGAGFLRFRLEIAGNRRPTWKNGRKTCARSTWPARGRATI